MALLFALLINDITSLFTAWVLKLPPTVHRHAFELNWELEADCLLVRMAVRLCLSFHVALQ